jgi:hypothetical protein
LPSPPPPSLFPREHTPRGLTMPIPLYSTHTSFLFSFLPFVPSLHSFRSFHSFLSPSLPSFLSFWVLSCGRREGGGRGGGGVPAAAFFFCRYFFWRSTGTLRTYRKGIWKGEGCA